MTVYVIAAATKIDDEGYAKYLAAAMRSLAPFPEARLCADPAPTLLEGTLPAQRILILQFEDDDAFSRWWADYQPAIPLRHNSAETAFLIKIVTPV
jgi:uncharacterized protein (DUF1330 family)